MHHPSIVHALQTSCKLSSNLLHQLLIKIFKLVYFCEVDQIVALQILSYNHIDVFIVN